MNEQPKDLPAPRDYYGVIEKVAAVKSLTSEDVEKLQRMMAMQEELEKRQAETWFNTRMSGAQSEMTRISKDSANPQTRSNYASLEALDEAIRPIYTSYGFAVTFNDETPDDRPDWLRLVAYVSCGAHTKKFQKWLPVGNTGMRGGTMMTPTHAAIASVTYGRRALLKMIFNLAEEDTDGVMDKQLQQARQTQQPRNVKEIHVDDAPDIPLDTMIEAMRACNDHTALYAYGQANRPSYLKFGPDNRKLIDQLYKQMMDEFAEQQK